jgi:N-acetylmuramoyl-L-alanine amidase
VAVAPAGGNAAQPAATPAPQPAAGADQAKPAAPLPVSHGEAAGAPHISIVIDAAHGGGDPGSRFSDRLLEKDVTLALARKLHSALQAQHAGSQLLRDSDVEISPDQRALTTNTLRPAIYISLHAAGPGSGVRVYSAMLAPVAEPAGSFPAWETAQASYSERSQDFASHLAGAFTSRQVAAGVSRAMLRPLNAVAAPAVAVEIAPPGDHVESIASDEYLKKIADILAQAVLDQLKNAGAGK